MKTTDQTILKVLMIEDNLADAELIRELLNQHHDQPFQIELVDHLDRARNLVQENQPDVILLDLSLPDSHGLDTLRQAHIMAPIVPIIVLTALSNESLGLEALREGAQDYLIKGEHDAKSILRSMRYAVERKRILLMKDQFIHTVTHELRTPLTYLRESISQMSDGLMGALSMEQKEMLSIALVAIDRLKHTSDELLDLAKVEAGETQISRTRFDLTDLIRETASAFTHQACARGLSLKVTVPDMPIHVYADRYKMGEVLTNFISNSMKFTERGHIELWITEDDYTVRCGVTDTGAGIAEDNLGKIFSKFEQFGKKSATGEKGTGLGLSICKSIIELHGGKIWVKSRRDDRTTFAFSVPKHDAKTLLKACLSESLKRAQKKKAPISVDLFDIGDLGPLREKLGADRVVTLLRKMEKVIHHTVCRKSDVVIGDSNTIILVLPETTKDAASYVAERALNALRAELNATEPGIHIPIRSKITNFPSDGGTAEDLYKRIFSE